MHRRLKSILLISSVILLGACLASPSKRELAEQVISRLESYREREGQLPDSLNQVGLNVVEEGPIYYEKRTNSSYILWYGLDLGESMTYDSVEKRWANHN